MKKFFTLIFALLGLSAAVSAASIDDVKVCQHSYVLVMDDVTNNGAAKPGKGNLFGDGYFLDVTGGSVATNKQNWDLSSEDAIAILGTDKYAEYGKHLNSFRLKNGQDVIAMKITAGSKLIILGQTHSSRWPQISDTAPSGNNMQGNKLAGLADGSCSVGKGVNTVTENGYFEWTADDDRTIYIGSHNGDYYISYIIVEANEAPGTPSVKVGEQAYDGGEGMWYREVTCKPNDVDGIPTICTYTIDGTEPTFESPVYTEPIRIYENCDVKFQAFMDMGDGLAYPGAEMIGGTNEVAVNFVFDAPTVTAEGGVVTIEAAADGAVNYYSIDGGEWVEGDEFTLTQSATVSCKSVYENPDVAVFESKSVTKDVYVLNPITEKKVITVTGGEVVVDEEATKNDPNGNTVYTVKDGAISADPMDFFVKNIVYAAVVEPEYQIDGQQVYIQMSNTTIDFELAEAAAVTVVCSKNSAKNLDTDKQCKITVDGGTYGGEDVTGTWELADAEGNIIETLPGNVVKFDLEAGHHQFKKYSGTGAIKIASITIEPGKSVFVKGGDDTGINNVNAASAAKTAKALVNGQLVIKSARGTFTAAGAQVK